MLWVVKLLMESRVVVKPIGSSVQYSWFGLGWSALCEMSREDNQELEGPLRRDEFTVSAIVNVFLKVQNCRF